MAQFTVYENTNEATKGTIPYLIDVQNDILSDLNSRVVIPMCSTLALGSKQMSNLSPTFEINGAPYTILTPQLAGLHISELGSPVCDLSEFRGLFINALDFLITGF